jgi:hypothetical protein
MKANKLSELVVEFREQAERCEKHHSDKCNCHTGYRYAASILESLAESAPEEAEIRRAAAGRIDRDALAKRIDVITCDLCMAGVEKQQVESPELPGVKFGPFHVPGEFVPMRDDPEATVGTYRPCTAKSSTILLLLEPLVGSRNAAQAEHDALVKCKDWLIRYGVHGQPLCEKRGCICGLNNAKDAACRALKTLDAEGR